MPAANAPPSDAAAQAEQRRQAAELAALSLFAGATTAAPAAAPVALSEAERRILTTIVTDLARGIVHQTLLAATAVGVAAYLQRRTPQTVVEEAVSKIVPEVVEDLEPSVIELRDLDKGTPLTSARLAASSFATRAYGEVATAAARAIPTPPELEGLVLKKTWVSKLDSRVRPLHARLHGRTKNMDEDFWRWPDTGMALAYPGDKRAPASAWINCRCSLWLTWASKARATEALAAAVDPHRQDTGWPTHVS